MGVGKCVLCTILGLSRASEKPFSFDRTSQKAQLQHEAREVSSNAVSLVQSNFPKLSSLHQTRSSTQGPTKGGFTLQKFSRFLRSPLAAGLILSAILVQNEPYPEPDVKDQGGICTCSDHDSESRIVIKGLEQL